MIKTGDAVLITGAAGQDGLLLAEQLRRDGRTVVGLVRNFEQASLLEKYAPGSVPVIGDLLDKESLRSAFDRFDPAYLVNLAAASSVAVSWQNPDLALRVNTLGLANLLDLVRDRDKHGSKITFYQASSSEMYGAFSQGSINELSPLQPTSPYAISKVAAHQLVQAYRNAYGLDLRIGIFFNHESPLRKPSFLTRKISQGVAKILLGRAQVLEIGDTTIMRDWGYADDFATAIRLILESESPDDYVVSTGAVHSIADLLGFAFKAIGIEHWEPYVRTSADLLRPIENTTIAGDSSKIRDQLGWHPSKNIAEVMQEMVAFDLQILSNETDKPLWKPSRKA